MIQFNDKDYFMPSIKAEAKLATLAVQKAYRIYGLKNDGNPPLLFRFNQSMIPEDRMAMVAHILEMNGIEADFINEDDKGLSIGIRRDVREHVLFTSALLQTIIYYIEGRLELPKDFRIPYDKKFKRNGQTEIAAPAAGNDGSVSPTPVLCDMPRLFEYYFGGRA
jgi:hypothetical protein